MSALALRRATQAALERLTADQVQLQFWKCHLRKRRSCGKTQSRAQQEQQCVMAVLRDKCHMRPCMLKTEDEWCGIGLPWHHLVRTVLFKVYSPAGSLSFRAVLLANGTLEKSRASEI
mmetsp:Transcript_50569/g.92723  ORF Transcript_50569/g.92723 Transcript_50569/m.92723 type:complete len:118 (-) Transcript_50569:45-398(-)